MAEILGIAAAALQLVELSAKTLSIGYSYLSSVADAPTEIRQLLRETAGLNCVLDQLHSIATQKKLLPQNENALLELQRADIFGSCKELLMGGKDGSGIAALLESNATVEGHAIRNMATRMAWPLRNRKDVTTKLQRLSHLVGILSVAVEVDTAQSTRRIESLQTSMQKGIEELSLTLHSQSDHANKEFILSWICPLPRTQVQKVLQDLIARRHPGTCEWMTRSPPFIELMEGSNINFLWLNALAGTGKSVLCAAIIEHLQSSVASRDIVVYFFCGNRNREERAAEELVMSLAAQFVSRSQQCLDIAFQKHQHCQGNPLTFDDYQNLIKAFIRQYEHVFIAIDALDEIGSVNDCRDKEMIAGFVDQCLPTPLSDAVEHGPAKSPRVKVILTSREDSTIRSELAWRNDAGCWTFSHDVNLASDLQDYITTGVRSRIKVRSKVLAENIQQTILHRAGTFLQAHHQLGMVTDTRTDAQVKAALKRLPQGLYVTYEQILANALRLYPSREEEMKETLQWLVVATVPITAEQIAEVISLQKGDTVLDFDNIVTEPDDILVPLSHLIRYSKSRGLNTAVKLHHSTVKEFLTSSDILGTPVELFYVEEREAHAAAAEKCLQFLSLSNFDSGVPDTFGELENTLEEYKFLQFAAVSWATHMRLSGLSAADADLDRLRPYLMWFLNPDFTGRYGFWKAVLELESGCRLVHTWEPLAYAISQDLQSLVELLLPGVEDLDRPLKNGYTCLYMAASRNNVSLARRLLASGAQVDLSSQGRRLTALHVAAESGHAEMVRFLLSRDASPSVRSEKGTTPFYRAARGGSTEVLRLLQQAGSEIDALTWDSWTPLMEAVESGHSDAVKLLLEWGANPTRSTSAGLLPLALAIKMCHPLEMQHMISRAIRARKGILETSGPVEGVAG